MNDTLGVGVEQASGRLGDIARAAGGAALIADDPDRLAAICQANHRLNEVPSLAPGSLVSVEAARSNDEMVSCEGPDGMFTGEFRDAVNADGPGWVGFSPWSIPLGVESEDKVGAEVEEPDPLLAAVSSQVGRADGVGGEGVGGVFFCLVDEVVGGGVHDGVP